MLALTEITKYYPEHLKGYQRFIIREYLQYKILQIVFDNVSFANKMCFLGGTCLRLVHENTRFSEDLDFDNFNLSSKDFEEVSSTIATELKKEGYGVEIRNVYKGAFHCYIRFPELLFKEGLSGHKEEKILIQLDTEPQHFDFKPDRHVLNKFDVFTEILTTPLDILLAQKFYAILNRPRPKGRDFFDVIFLLGKTKPNFDYLKLKLDIDSPIHLKSAILERCDKIDMEQMARDVSPFLFNARDEKRVSLFVDYLRQVAL
ncbi:MAG: nucleotidyl transferase AbiEii/AbiGii toxin family protein [Cyclobacteriaceae bacterium]